MYSRSDPSAVARTTTGQGAGEGSWGDIADLIKRRTRVSREETRNNEETNTTCSNNSDMGKQEDTVENNFPRKGNVNQAGITPAESTPVDGNNTEGACVAYTMTSTPHAKLNKGK